MALGAHKVVVELVATGQKAASEFKKVSLEAEGLNAAQKTAGGSSSFLSSGLVRAGVAAATTFAAIKTGAAVVGDLIDSFTSAASEVRSFERVSGASAETSSKFVFALKTVGVSADTAATGIFMLGKKIGQGKINLEQFGVSVKKASNGSTDLTGTVLNIADAYQHMQDPAKRSALAMEAFGRSGKSMLPFLARGKAGIKELFDEAARTNHIFSQDDLDRAKEFGLASHELGQTLEGIKIKAGGALTPVVTDMTRVLSSLAQMGSAIHIFDVWAGLIKQTAFPLIALVDGAKKFTNAIGLTSNETNKFGIAQKYLNDKQAEYASLVATGNGHSKEARDLRKEITGLNGALGTTQDKVSKALETTAQKADDAEKALTTLKGTLFGFGDAQRGAESAVLRLNDAQRKGADAVDKYNAARAAGKGADETDEQFQRRLAGLQDDVTQGFLDIASAHDDVAKAAVDAVTSQKAYEEAIKDPKARQALIAQLIDAKAKYGDTTGAIQDQIDKLNDYDKTNPKPKKLDVDTGAAQTAVAGLHGAIAGIESKTVTISAQVQVLGAAAADATLRTLILLKQIFGNGKAGGGPVRGGKAVLVGEEGPELFVPPGNGRILSNKDSMAKLNTPVASNGGSSAPVYNVTVNGAINSAEAGRVVVNAIKEYERGSGKSWRG